MAVDKAAATLAGGLRSLPPQLAAALQTRVNWDRGADLAHITALPRGAPESQQAEELISRIRRDIVPASELAGTGSTVYPPTLVGSGPPPDR